MVESVLGTECREIFVATFATLLHFSHFSQEIPATFATRDFFIFDRKSPFDFTRIICHQNLHKINKVRNRIRDIHNSTCDFKTSASFATFSTGPYFNYVRKNRGREGSPSFVLSFYRFSIFCF